MATHKLLVQPELAAKRTHFILKKLAQRLDQLHIHALGQSADIVMRFDRHRRPASERDTFDHIRVKRALGEEICTAQLLRFLFEHGDKLAADKFALFLRIGDAIKARHKALLCIHDDERDIVMIAKQAFDLLALVHAQQSVIDENAGELVANRFVDQDRGDRAIDPA